MRRSNSKQWLILSGFFFTTVAFQNCGQEVGFNSSKLGKTNVAFSSENTLGSDEVQDMTQIALVPLETEDDSMADSSDVAMSEENSTEESYDKDQETEEGDNQDQDRSIASLPSAQENPSMTEPEQEDLPSIDDDSSKQNQDQKSCSKKNQRVSQNSGHEDEFKQEREDHSSRTSDYMYRCVLAGKGKSIHIGFIDDKIVADKDTPETLCMSENACLNIMPTLGFEVKEAQFTGYCAHGKAHTRPITDAEAVALASQE